MWRKRSGEATLEDVVEYLQGIGTALMTVAATLQTIEKPLTDDDDEADI